MLYMKQIYQVDEFYFFFIGVQESDSVIHTCIPIFLRFFFLIGYYKILSRVPFAIGQVLVDYIIYIYIYISVFILIPTPNIIDNFKKRTD